MTVTRLFHGKVVSHGFVPNDPTRWMRHVATLDGKEVTASMEKRRKVRSLDQNSYYWKVVIGMLAEYCGDFPEAIHDACRMKFLTDHSGKLPTIRSTTSLDTKEFSDYLENCIQLAAELGVVIPNPFFVGEAAR